MTRQEYLSSATEYYAFHCASCDTIREDEFMVKCCGKTYCVPCFDYDFINCIKNETIQGVV